MLLKLLIFTKRHIGAPFKETKVIFVKKKLWIPRFGIRENMSRAR